MCVDFDFVFECGRVGGEDCDLVCVWVYYLVVCVVYVDWVCVGWLWF